MASLPELRACLLAEQVRPEMGGAKLTMLGYLGIAPDTQLFIPSFPGALNLAVIFQFGRSAEDATLRFQFAIDGPGGNVVPLRDGPEPIRFGAGKSAALVLQFGDMPIPVTGRYLISLYHDQKKIYESEFEVIPGKA